jgi:hypothetical protein
VAREKTPTPRNGDTGDDDDDDEDKNDDGNNDDDGDDDNSSWQTLMHSGMKGLNLGTKTN